MAANKAESVEQYLADLPPERRGILTPVRETIIDNLQPGFEESMIWKMPTYEIPLATFPDTYNKKPLMYCALAAQKNHNAIYLCSVYSDQAMLEKLQQGYRAAGLKLDMGKSCIRFKKLEQVPLDVIGQIIAGYSVDDFIKNYRGCHRK